MKPWAFILTCLLLLQAASCRANPKGDMTPGSSVRESAVSGKFYPADQGKLGRAIRGFLGDALPSKGERPLAIVVPHAGYVFSGPIAADAWRQVQGQDLDVIVILGTNHTVTPFHGVAVSGYSGYRTPLGIAPVDLGLAQALRKACASAVSEPVAHAREHSVEVQVPFVQALFPRAKILPCIVGSADPGLCAEFGRTLGKVLEGRKALVVASSDLSHYPKQTDATTADRKVLAAAASLDPAAFLSAIQEVKRQKFPGLDTCACGEGPILAAMSAAKALGAKRGTVLSYANSGDTLFGDSERVVGYGALMYTSGEGKPDTSVLDSSPTLGASTLGETDRAILLKLARTTLDRFFATDTVPMPRPSSAALRRNRGAFVTLTLGGNLRGCIGHMAEDLPLGLVVGKMALQAALNDRRFSPVKADELARIHIEISALTPLAPIKGPSEIVLGRDGVVLAKEGRRAVFLPQVALEQGWTKEEMLRQLCRKAGLPDDAWRSGAEFWTFQAEVFAEPKRP